MSDNMSFIFSHLVIYKIVKCIGQSENSSLRLSGFKFYHIMLYRVHITISGIQTGSCNSNDHATTITRLQDIVISIFGSSTNKTDYNDIAEILLKVALNTITITHTQFCIKLKYKKQTILQKDIIIRPYYHDYKITRYSYINILKIICLLYL
jgi:superoxide dismutase